jgi:membrane protease YdiL (CAAX protease family)
MGVIAAIFWNARERRLRAGWRLLIQLVLFLAMLLGLAVVGRALGQGPAAVATGTVLYLATGLALAWILARFVDRRRFVDYGFCLDARWWLDFAFGLTLGAALMTGIFLTQRACGWLTVAAPAVTESGLTAVPAFLLSLFFYAVVSVNEEFAFRGYQLRNLAEGLAGRWLSPRAAIVIAWVAISGVFGLAHATNDGATAQSTLNLVLTTGGLLGLPFVLTGELAIPIGLHLSWNLFEGTVYGFPVSGSVPSRRLLIPEQGGPPLWTGGAFGPEAGLLATLAAVIGCGLIALWVRARSGGLALRVSLARYDAPSPMAPATGAEKASDRRS